MKSGRHIGRFDEKFLEISLLQQHPLVSGVFRLWYWVCNWMDKVLLSKSAILYICKSLCILFLTSGTIQMRCTLEKQRQHYKLSHLATVTITTWGILRLVRTSVYRHLGEGTIKIFFCDAKDKKKVMMQHLAPWSLHFLPPLCPLDFPVTSTTSCFWPTNSISCCFAEGTVLSSYL